MIGVVLSLLLLVSHQQALQRVSALRIEEYYDSVKSWMYVARFAFIMEPLENTKSIYDSVQATTIDPTDEDADPFRKLVLTGGRLVYKFSYPLYSQPKLLVFQDYDDWAEVVAEPQTSCHDLVASADKVIELTKHHIYGQSSAYDDTLSIEYQNIAAPGNTSSQGVVFFPQVSTVRARWGSFILANCDAAVSAEDSTSSSSCQGPIVVDSDLHFVNYGPEDGRREFSYDDVGLQYVSLFCYAIDCSSSFLSFLVCDVSVSLSLDLLLPACTL
jgi:hypothetical protein